MTTRLGLAVMMAGLLLLTVGTSTASATGDEAATCVTFPDVRLLNLPGEDRTETQPLSLPAGRYAIELDSRDDTHVTHAADPSQTAESWWLVLNGEIAVGPTRDIADDEAQNLTVLEAQLPTITEYYAEHLGSGNINSVHPQSACFTLLPMTTTTTMPPRETTTTTSLAPETTTAGPTTTASTVAPTTTTIPVTKTIKEPELALTGPAETTVMLSLVGLAMILAGASMMWFDPKTSR